MKYLNFKWIHYEVKGRLIVINCTTLNWLSLRLRRRKDGTLLRTRYFIWFIKYYAKSIAQLNNYMIYGQESGLQKISDSCWWNKR